MLSTFKYCFGLVIILVSGYVHAQDVYVAVDEMPKPIEGYEAFDTYIMSQIYYPQEALDQKASGYVFVRFVVEVNGKINHVSIVKGIHRSCDAEVLRVFSNLKPWIPGKHHGKHVRVQITMPIIFKSQ